MRMFMLSVESHTRITTMTRKGQTIRSVRLLIGKNLTTFPSVAISPVNRVLAAIGGRRACSISG
jgi:hypothetical protein